MIRAERCPGGVSQPNPNDVTVDPGDHPVGKCSSCGAWVRLLKSGLIRDHRLPRGA